MKRGNTLSVPELSTELGRESRKRKLEHNNSSRPDAKLFKKLPSRPVKLSEEPLNLRCKWHSCGYNFDSWQNFDSHLMHHVGITVENLTCQWTTCEYGATSIPRLLQHVSYHGYISKLMNIGQNVVERLSLSECKQKKLLNIPNDNFGYACDWEYCSQNFVTIHDFLVHLKSHIKSDPTEPKSGELKCRWTGCDATFRDQSKLSEHLRTHSKEKTIGCPTCFTVFSTKTKFCDHRTRQQSGSEQTFKCPECFKLFPSSRLLRDHVRCHRYAYKCNLCDMTCAKPSLVVKHLRFKHVMYKAYDCPKCDKKFVTQQNLDRHVKIHEKHNPMKCDLCDFSCRSRVGLTSHRVTTHDDAGSVYECHYCKVNFQRGRYLSQHLMKQHNCQLPPGFSRFKYRKEEDGIYRLQVERSGCMDVMSSGPVPTNEGEGVVNSLLSYETDEEVSNTGSAESLEYTEEYTVMDDVLITFHRFDECGNEVIHTL